MYPFLAGEKDFVVVEVLGLAGSLENLRWLHGWFWAYAGGGWCNCNRGPRGGSWGRERWVVIAMGW